MIYYDYRDLDAARGEGRPMAARSPEQPGLREPIQHVRFHESDISQQSSGDVKMSLIVAIQNSHGLVFSSDSRSTNPDSIGGMRIDKNRNAKKVFQSKKYIAATFGRNTIIENKAHIPIEMVIESIIARAPNLAPQEFVDLFRGHLRETFLADNNAMYHIIVGYPVSEGFCFEHCICTPSGMDVNTCLGNQLVFFGSFDTTPRNITVNGNWSIEELKSASEMLVRSAIEIGDRFMAYNPIGGPIQSVCLATPYPD